MSFNKYFQDELNYLRQLGADFARTYPALAPMLADRGGDPDVERLLEGVAFLTGRVRQKLDDELPELMLAVSSLLFPQLIRPLPASSVLELTPIPGVMRERRILPRGAEFDSVPVDGTRCRFTTTNACEIAPIELAEVRLETGVTGAQQLRLRIKPQPGLALDAALPSKLRLHLAAAERSAQVLYLWLLRHVSEVRIVGTSPGSPSELRLRPDVLRSVGFEDDEALLPWDETGFPGFRLLQEYNVLPAKFAFVDLQGFDRVASFGAQPQGVDVIFVFDAQLKQLRDLGPADVKLHCVPVVNVFQSTAEPIRVDPGREQHLVRVAGLSPQQGEVYSITKLRGISRNSAQLSEILPFVGFEHVAQANSGQGAFYTVHLRPSVVSEGADTYVSVGTAEDSGSLADFETLSIELLATNGPLANAVRSGEIRVTTPSSPSYAQFKNLAAATPHVPPPLGQELQWRATAHVAMNLRSLTEPQVLRSVLGTYNLRAITDRQAARANELRMQAIRDVEVRPAERLFRGALIRGVQIHVTLDESGFLGEGDAFLFGNVLERLFADYVSLNSFSQTRVSLTPSQTVWSWPPRNGAQTLL